MTEEINPLTPLSDHDSEEEETEGSNQTASRPSNKRSKKQKSTHVPKKIKTLEKTHKYKSWCGNGGNLYYLITEILVQNVQTTLTNKILPHNETKQVQLSHQSLVDWFIADSMPLKLVQSEMFKKFLHDLDPGFIVPDVKLIKKIIHSAYNYTLPLIVQYIEDHAISVNLTTDLWTARNRQGFIGVTCCFLDENFQLHELVLAVTYVRYPHTADHISDTLLELLDHWLLREKVNVITTDNGSNIKKAIKDMNEISSNITWQPCTTHTLKLVVGKGLACNPRKTSTYLRHCITDVATQWNSSFLAWKRLLEVKPYIDILSTTLPIANDADSKRDGERLSEIMLTKDEWELLRDLCEVLKGFAEATTYLGAKEIVDDFSEEEEGEMAERKNRQSVSGRLNLNMPFNTTGMIEKVKLHLYNAMELYWNKEEEETLISALLESSEPG
ncbi:hypothetical protein RclHR1_16630004 [Rhizophagus clarus]|uniref:DUF659 domain-containing protein n=1 Tax=Rhizophagus clarus TaxID=94130 RepID=A0A2Z6QVF0_9GLOM|nr:hypothetical protein RclHR1_16630004 [Rhizophagus clarus]